MSSLIIRGLTYYWRTQSCRGVRCGDRGRRARRGTARRRLRTRQPSRSRGRTTGQDRLRGHIDRVFSRAARRRPARAARCVSQIARCVPLVAANAVVSVQQTGRKAGQVRVYGVDDRFWRFHGVEGVSGPSGRDAYVSPALAAQLEAGSDSVILVRVRDQRISRSSRCTDVVTRSVEHCG